VEYREATRALRQMARAELEAGPQRRGRERERSRRWDRSATMKGKSARSPYGGGVCTCSVC
jgi:hypothetical protein